MLLKFTILSAHNQNRESHCGLGNWASWCGMEKRRANWAWQREWGRTFLDEQMEPEVSDDSIPEYDIIVPWASQSSLASILEKAALKEPRGSIRSRRIIERSWSKRSFCEIDSQEGFIIVDLIEEPKMKKKHRRNSKKTKSKKVVEKDDEENKGKNSSKK